jgi:hypothetical protein
MVERSRGEQIMPNMTNKQDLIAYFAEKSQRSAKDGGAYFETVNEMLMLFDQTDNVAEIKAVVRNLHREKLKEIQRTESSVTRIELRKQLGIYDDCLTQTRTIAVP